MVKNYNKTKILKYIGAETKIKILNRRKNNNIDKKIVIIKVIWVEIYQEIVENVFGTEKYINFCFFESDQARICENIIFSNK